MTQTARQKLGEVLTFQLGKQHKSNRDISDRCGVPIRDVERWKAGELVPDKLQWKRLCQMVAKGLFSCSSMHGDALKEQDEEREATARALRRNGHTVQVNGRVVTNFGDKLVTAGVAPVQAPSPVPARSAPAEPQDDEASDRRGHRAIHAQSAERLAFARRVLVERPHIPTRGPDGLIAMAQKEFGIGLSDANVAVLRIQAKNEAVGQPATTTRVAAVPQPTSGAQPVPDKQVNDADVQAAIEIILTAIPELQDLTIKVSDDGAASVSYQVRKVQVTTVSPSLTVRR